MDVGGGADGFRERRPGGVAEPRPTAHCAPVEGDKRDRASHNIDLQNLIKCSLVVKTIRLVSGWNGRFAEED